MTAVQQSVKKTGYQDIDKILMEANKLLQEGDQLEKEIAQAVKFKPRIPYSTSKQRALKRFRFRYK
ncbi:hypothetical protein [Siminovitchia fortis]|uniref:Uncharacterized protein n=1 Tax=Siminovitchia fortis TaxID=254758 RepID=A0A443IUZ0_9BACI|nr:hypothetical protein [Siminovitchia fortis]RWR11905.1 hypothetical protein D4N35_008195 [Siminovitchia fortis]WHY81812.1 hypothetical protein QNH23_18420 [Siminovitchia fortis]